MKTMNAIRTSLVLVAMAVSFGVLTAEGPCNNLVPQSGDCPTPSTYLPIGTQCSSYTTFLTCEGTRIIVENYPNRTTTSYDANAYQDYLKTGVRVPCYKYRTCTFLGGFCRV